MFRCPSVSSSSMLRDVMATTLLAPGPFRSQNHEDGVVPSSPCTCFITGFISVCGSHRARWADTMRVLTCGFSGRPTFRYMARCLSPCGSPRPSTTGVWILRAVDPNWLQVHKWGHDPIKSRHDCTYFPRYFEDCSYADAFSFGLGDLHLSVTDVPLEARPPSSRIGPCGEVHILPGWHAQSNVHCGENDGTCLWLTHIDNVICCSNTETHAHKWHAHEL